MPTVNLITSLPNFVSKEEHAVLVGSTPNSFSDIPPVVRHKEENVTISLDPPVDGFSDPNACQGTIYILTSLLVFMSSNGAGFQVEYPSITLHAVSRGESGPSIYCQLDESTQTQNGIAHDSNEEEVVTDMRELTIVPQNSESLDSIFEALSQCASLHPDSRDEDDDMDDDAFIDVNGLSFETFDGDESQELSEVGRAALAHLESIIYDPHNFKRSNENAEDDTSEEK